MRNRELHDRIMAFQVDSGIEALSFIKRLARENGWSIEFSQRVFEEYKRFAYLCMVSDQPCTPSDEVDQAWHLHMLYVESYLDDFCREVLGRRLTHGPTKGGKAEGSKFEDWYERTKRLYREEFGADAPTDIWPPSEVRFGMAPHFQRVNLAENWVIPKSAGRKLAMPAVLIALLTTAGCLAQVNSSGDGTTIFIFLVVAGVVGFAIWKAIKNPGGGGGGNGSGCSSTCGGDSGCGSSGCGSGCSGCGGGCGGCGS